MARALREPAFIAFYSTCIEIAAFFLILECGTTLVIREQTRQAIRRHVNRFEKDRIRLRNNRLDRPSDDLPRKGNTLRDLTDRQMGKMELNLLVPPLSACFYLRLFHDSSFSGCRSRYEFSFSLKRICKLMFYIASFFSFGGFLFGQRLK